MSGLSTAAKLRIARLARTIVGAPLKLRGRTLSDVVCIRRGVHWSLDLDEGVQLAMYLGVYEPSTTRALARLARGATTVIDVGANVGAQALPLASRIGPGGHVIAIEPADAAMERLRRNAALNPALSDRLVLVHRALVAPGERPAGSYFASWPLAGGERVHPVHGGAAAATTAAGSTFDALVGELGLASVDLVKLDVDGRELPVLRGAAATLARWRPTVVFELCPYLLVEHGERPADLPQLFVDRGYRLCDERTFTPFHGGVGALLARVPAGGSLNVVAVPAEREGAIRR